MLVAAALAAVSAWPMYQFRADHNAVLASPAMRVSWTRRLGGKINGGLAFAHGALFVESFDRRVSALDARSGRVLWSTEVSNIVMTTPIVADRLVIVGTGTSTVLTQSANALVWGRPQGDEIVALDEGTGRVRWRRSTAGEDMPSPALVNIRGVDAVVFANGDNHLRAWAVRDGHTLWERAVSGIASMSSAAVDGRRVFVVIGDGSHSGTHDHLIAIEPNDGRIVWGAPYGNADCSPTIAARTVFVEGSNADARHAQPNAFNDVAAVDERTGTVRWRWYSGYGTFTGAGSDEEGVAGLAADGALYQSIPATNEFIAFDARTGNVRWKIRTGAAVKMSAVERAGRLYFGDTGGTFYAVDARSGRVISRTPHRAYFSVSSPVIVGDTLYVADKDVVRAAAFGTNSSASPSMQ
ncbi:MAG TPA: PQQ-binding-like beta-propeller repeat protein [Candidatus Baltobacteraceae bacterium]|nr:PQQ-binding-like beta-propeller repeat protein [Candidatus Baltobacteraceae bacterium]